VRKILLLDTRHLIGMSVSVHLTNELILCSFRFIRQWLVSAGCRHIVPLMFNTCDFNQHYLIQKMKIYYQMRRVFPPTSSASLPPWFFGAARRSSSSSLRIFPKRA
jgi:hypothetical protein